MVAQDQVDPVGVLALQGGDQVDELVRLISPVVGIEARPVDELLQDQVTLRVRGERGLLEHLAEEGEVAVQVADDQDIQGGLDRDDAPSATGRGPEEIGRAAEHAEQLDGVGHETIGDSAALALASDRRVAPAPTRFIVARKP